VGFFVPISAKQTPQSGGYKTLAVSNERSEGLFKRIGTKKQNNSKADVLKGFG
jgi:hypothetical protein